MTAAAWDELELYGNRDLLSRAYVHRHGGKLSEKKARQISANLAQGRQYFNASFKVGLIAKPLLVYYGVLSICRAIILYRDRASGEESLHSSHGLAAVGWAQTLAGSLVNIRDLKMEVTAGTFGELLDATKNVERFTPPLHAAMSKEGVVPTVSLRLPAATQLTFGDALSRIPELSELHMRVFERRSEAFISWISGAGGDIPHELLTFNVVDLVPTHSVDELAQLLNIAKLDDARGTFDSSQFGSKQVCIASIKLGEGLGAPKSIPPLARLVSPEPSEQHTYYFNWPIQGQFYPTTLARMFMLSYCLGMLARYFPSVWMSGISNENDTASFPLLTRSISILQQNFPSVALAEFTAE